MRWGPLIALAFTGAFLVGCGSSGGETPAERDEPSTAAFAGAPAAAPVAPHPANMELAAPGPCGGGLPVASASVRRAFETTAGTREYLLFQPSQAAGGMPLPLVFNFHGRGGDAATQERYSGLLPIAERTGFILVSPEGTGSPRAWAAGATPASGVDDVAFVRELLVALKAELCIDPARVYATGFSNGAFMASRLACALGDQISAFAAVAGVTHEWEKCAAPVPALAIHGTHDTLVPFERGTIRATFPYAGARSEAREWASHNGCGAEPSVERLSPSVTRESYPGGRAPVVLYVVQSGGHTWPGAPDIPGLGLTTKDVSAAEVIWAFFAAHPRVKG